MCIYRREGKGKWGKQIFFEKRGIFFERGIGELDSWRFCTEAVGFPTRERCGSDGFGAVAQVGKSA